MFTIAGGVILGFFGILVMMRILNSATVALLMDLPGEVKKNDLKFGGGGVRRTPTEQELKTGAEKLTQVKPNQYVITKGN